MNKQKIQLSYNKKHYTERSKQYKDNIIKKKRTNSMTITIM